MHSGVETSADQDKELPLWVWDKVGALMRLTASEVDEDETKPAMPSCFSCTQMDNLTKLMWTDLATVAHCSKIGVCCWSGKLVRAVREWAQNPRGPIEERTADAGRRHLLLVEKESFESKRAFLSRDDRVSMCRSSRSYRDNDYKPARSWLYAQIVTHDLVVFLLSVGGKNFEDLVFVMLQSDKTDHGVRAYVMDPAALGKVDSTTSHRSSRNSNITKVVREVVSFIRPTAFDRADNIIVSVYAGKKFVTAMTWASRISSSFALAQLMTMATLRGCVQKFGSNTKMDNGYPVAFTSAVDDLTLLISHGTLEFKAGRIYTRNFWEKLCMGALAVTPSRSMLEQTTNKTWTPFPDTTVSPFPVAKNKSQIKININGRRDPSMEPISPCSYSSPPPSNSSGDSGSPKQSSDGLHLKPSANQVPTFPLTVSQNGDGRGGRNIVPENILRPFSRSSESDDGDRDSLPPPEFIPANRKKVDNSANSVQKRRVGWADAEKTNGRNQLGSTDNVASDRNTLARQLDPRLRNAKPRPSTSFGRDTSRSTLADDNGRPASPAATSQSNPIDSITLAKVREAFSDSLHGAHSLNRDFNIRDGRSVEPARPTTPIARPKTACGSRRPMTAYPEPALAPSSFDDLSFSTYRSPVISLNAYPLRSQSIVNGFHPALDLSRISLPLSPPPASPQKAQMNNMIGSNWAEDHFDSPPASSIQFRHGPSTAVTIPAITGFSTIGGVTVPSFASPPPQPTPSHLVPPSSFSCASALISTDMLRGILASPAIISPPQMTANKPSAALQMRQTTPETVNYNPNVRNFGNRDGNASGSTNRTTDTSSGSVLSSLDSVSRVALPQPRSHRPPTRNGNRRSSPPSHTSRTSELRSDGEINSDNTHRKAAVAARSTTRDGHHHRPSATRRPVTGSGRRMTADRRRTTSSRSRSRDGRSQSRSTSSSVRWKRRRSRSRDRHRDSPRKRTRRSRSRDRGDRTSSSRDRSSRESHRVRRPLTASRRPVTASRRRSRSPNHDRGAVTSRFGSRVLVSQEKIDVGIPKTTSPQSILSMVPVAVASPTPMVIAKSPLPPNSEPATASALAVIPVPAIPEKSSGATTSQMTSPPLTTTAGSYSCVLCEHLYNLFYRSANLTAMKEHISEHRGSRREPYMCLFEKNGNGCFKTESCTAKLELHATKMGHSCYKCGVAECVYATDKSVKLSEHYRITHHRSVELQTILRETCCYREDEDFGVNDVDRWIKKN